MSRADDIFISMCRSIIENGYSTKGEKVRPKWEDGTSAYTKYWDLAFVNLSSQVI